MTAEGLDVKLAEVDSRARSNTRRIDKLEQSNEALNRLATSVEVLATQQKQMAETVERLDGKVSDIEAKPAKRWDNLTATVINWVVIAILAAVIVFK